MTHIQTREHAPRLAPTGRPLGPRPGPAHAHGGLTARDLTKALRRRKWTIILTSLIILAITVVATLLWSMYAPIYSTVAYIRLTPPMLTALQNAPTQSAELLDRYKRGQAALVKSPAVLTKALESAEVQRTRWFGKRRTADLKIALKELDKEIGVSSMPDTEFIGIGMSLATATREEMEELPTIVNAVARAFVEEANKATNEQRTESIRQLTLSRNELNNELLAVLRAIAGAVGGMPVPSMRNQVSSLTIELQETTRQITQLAVYQSQAEAALLSLQELERSGNMEAMPEVLQALDLDPLMRSLLAAMMNLQTELANAKERFGPDHRTVQTLQNRIVSVQAAAETRRHELINAQVQALKSSRQGMRDSITAQLIDIRTRRQAVLVQVRELEDSLLTIENLETRKLDLESRLRNVDDRLFDRRAVVQDPQGLPAFLREPARIPLEPTWPKWTMMIPLGLVFGLGLGVGLAFLIELVDTSVKTSTDVTRRLDLPLLAMIPHADDLAEEIEEVRTAGLLVPQSLISEAYRELRTNLMFSGPAEQRRTLLASSPSPEDGRTSVALNLALAQANNGRRVLLVDANFRRPGLKTLFPAIPDEGFSNALSGQAAWRECVAESGVANLTLMASGPMPPNPTELLGAELARSIVDEMAAEYDQVIFDGPPLLLVTDAAVLATLVDGVLLVVRAGVNTYGIVQRCRDVLTRVGAHMTGVVLNGVRTTVGGYLRKNYETFYEYQEQED